MGFHGGGFDRVALKPPQTRSAVIKVDHEAFGLIVMGVGFWWFRMLGCDTRAFKKTPEAQDALFIKELMLQAGRCMQHQRFAAG
jgi:hypothetical protein